jgi:diadenylate cyclase
MKVRVPRNLAWKAGSLVLSILLWIAYIATPDVVTNHQAPILYRNLAPELILTGEPLSSLDIELRGSASNLTAAALANTVVSFDLSAISTPGERTFTVSEDNINLPPGVTFLRAVPSQLRLRFARLVTRDVPVEISLTGAPPKGFRLAARGVSPPVLRIAGSEERVAAIKSVLTDTLDLSNVTQSGDYKTVAFVTDPQVHFESSPLVTVRIVIERVEKTK